jgi:hypothetical protein
MQTEEISGRSILGPDGRVMSDDNLKEIYRRLRQNASA